ncbi:MAG: DUF2256 domain-containing protein [Actinomycetota bacterium]|nr:DUF2256 domain-containing protein [Actinomycetota bacterium]MDA3020857.1 DUF2256 domain-containing protein [Actinomycetota bacterium]
MSRVAQTKNGHPPKVCAACNRPFEWRKKWERVWDEVRWCSDACRSDGSLVRQQNLEAQS